MISGGSILVRLVRLVDHLPFPPPPARRKRGRQRTYSDRLIVKALVVMIIRRLYTAWALLAFLQQEDPVVQHLRPLLTENGQFPTRRTWERRLAALPATLPGLIGRLGRHLVTVLNPWAQQGHGAACDSTAVRAHGGVWHKKDREAGVVPHTAIDTEAHWSKSGWHGWWYGWKLHLAVSIGSLWIPLAASSPPPISLTVTSRRCCSPSSLPRSVMSWATNITTPRTCGPSVPGTTVNWWQLTGGPILIEMGGLRSGGCFINCARTRLNPSMACSRTSLSGAASCPSRGYSGVNSWRWGPYCSINSCCSINTNTTN